MKKEERIQSLEAICKSLYLLEQDNSDETYTTNVYVRYAGRLEALIKIIGIYGLDRAIEIFLDIEEVF